MDEEINYLKVFIKNTKKYYTVLPWEGDRFSTNNVKMYPIYCEVCSNDKELFPEKILIRKGDALKGYCPCACSGGYKYSELQYKILVKRNIQNKPNLSIVDFEDPYKGIKSTRFSTYCSIHNTYNYKQKLNSRFCSHKFFCHKCSKDSLSKSKIKSTKTYLENLTGEGYYLIKDPIKKCSGGFHRYWYYFCDTCSKDNYVKLGLCSGTFSTTTGALQMGQKPCRCNSVKYNKAMATYLINTFTEERGYSFINWVESYTNASTPFEYACKEGHINRSSLNKILQGYGCKSCNNYGFYPSRSTEVDTLYVIELKNTEETPFVKIGRSFNTKERFREYTKSYDVEILYTKRSTHREIFNLEQKLLQFFADFSIIPTEKFGGSSKECFSFLIKDLLEGALIFLDRY